METCRAQRQKAWSSSALKAQGLSQSGTHSDSNQKGDEKNEISPGSSQRGRESSSHTDTSQSEREHQQFQSKSEDNWHEGQSEHERRESF
eukprot:6161923-Amphidinium_carterae.1